MWRRDITETEIQNLNLFLTEIHQQSNSIYTTIEYGLAIILQSPHFYTAKKWEMRKDDLQVLNWQINSLSYCGIPSPDQELLDLASSDEILDQTVLYEQSIRMMNDHRFQQGLRSIFRDFFALQGLKKSNQRPIGVYMQIQI